MGELMSKHIEDNRARQPEERDQPEDRAQREEPKFFARPKPLRHGRARKDGEKCLTDNGADRQQKECENKLYPSCRDHEGIRRGNPESIRGPRDISNDLPVALGVPPYTSVCRSSLRRSQSYPKITQISPDLGKTINF